MWEISCKECGGKSAASLWLETPLGIKFPAGHLQCPACKVAVVRRQDAPDFFEYEGKVMVIPGRITLCPAVSIQ